MPLPFIASRRYRLILCAVILFGLFTLALLWNHERLPQQTKPGLVDLVHTADQIDWSRFAYVQYVTNSDYLCNSVMFFEALQRLSSRADRVMMYPSGMLHSGQNDSSDARLLHKAQDEYNVKLVPISVQHRKGADKTWAESFTKLLAFNQTQYSRVLSIDSDSTLLQNMDELFLIPPAPVAMPRAYWLFPEKPILSSQLVLIEPSESEFARVMDRVNSAGQDDYDMEIVNYLYGANALVLPHRPFDMLTAEFRFEDHSRYLGTDREEWDPVAAYNEVKLIHFSDWPLPKPWLDPVEDVRVRIQPKCQNTTQGMDCASQIIWNVLYSDFKKRRKEICDLTPNGLRRAFQT